MSRRPVAEPRNTGRARTPAQGTGIPRWRVIVSSYAGASCRSNGPARGCSIWALRGSMRRGQPNQSGLGKRGAIEASFRSLGLTTEPTLDRAASTCRRRVAESTAGQSRCPSDSRTRREGQHPAEQLGLEALQLRVGPRLHRLELVADARPAESRNRCGAGRDRAELSTRQTAPGGLSEPPWPSWGPASQAA